MVVWQKEPDYNATDSIETGRITPSLDRCVSTETMKLLHKLDKTVLPHGSRSQPVQNLEEIELDRWFKENTVKRNIAGIQNAGWLLARLAGAEGQHVPLWRSYNEACCVNNPPMTTIGILPILQAPADEYDTITTIINRFSLISKQIGQIHTIITTDQPLYSKGEELVLANHDLYKNIIFRLGGLHVCFNFLKAIGQHVESAGLDDLWIDSGVYPPNVTENKLDGKAYYRAVRAHTLTYETLWRLRW